MDHQAEAGEQFHMAQLVVRTCTETARSILVLASLLYFFPCQLVNEHQ